MQSKVSLLLIAVKIDQKIQEKINKISRSTVLKKFVSTDRFPVPVASQRWWVPTPLCVGFVLHITPSDTLCSIISLRSLYPALQFQFEIKFNFSFLNSD